MDAKSNKTPKPETAIKSAAPPPVLLSSTARIEAAQPGFAGDISLAWPRSAQLVALGLVIFAAALLLVNAVELMPDKARPTELATGAALNYRLDLNRASRAELLQIPGIGPKLAQRIETYRSTQGPFQDIKDLDKVKGIGPAIIERLEGWVYVDEDKRAGTTHPARSPPAQKPAWNPKEGAKQHQVNHLTNVNTASQAELQRLPRIGPTLSQRIIDARPFESIDDLRRVRGIGVKTLAALRPHVTVK